MYIHVKMYVVIALSGLGLGLICAGSKATQGVLSVPPPAEMMNEQFRIDRADLPRLETKALGGDIQAGDKLIRYFGPYRNDDASAAYWLQINAENGDPRSQRGMATVMAQQARLHRDNGAAYITRACFWMKIAVRNGYLINPVIDSDDVRQCQGVVAPLVTKR